MKNILLLFALLLLVASDRTYAESSQSIAGLAYSPSHLSTTYEEHITEAHLRQDFASLIKLTNRVRTYSVDNGMERVPAIAREFGMKVSLGIWLGSNHEANDLEISRALKVISAYPSAIDRVFVGNETLLRGDLNVEELRGYLRTVREGVHAPHIQITTGETWGFWQKYPALAADCDVIGAHIFPYWDRYPVEGAVAEIAEQTALLERLFPGKEIVIAETGWPSRGETRGAAVPSPEGQKSFLDEFIASPVAKTHDYYIVEAFDQPWKAPLEGQVGTGWGLFDVDGKPKVTFAPR